MFSKARTHPADRRRRPASAHPSGLVFDNPGALTAFVHRPDDLPTGAALVVALHGCTQAGPAYARDAGWIEMADRAGFVVLAPGQVRSNNPNLCFNWYSEDHAGHDGREVRSILAMIDAAIEAHDLDRGKVFITGLSAGAAMAFALICHHPQVFAGAGIIAGLPAGRATSLSEALALMKGRQPQTAGRPRPSFILAPSQAPSVSIWHGQADQIVVPSNADAIAAQWAELTGLPGLPATSERSGKLAREVWTRADGTVAMEINRIAGFGHATPLDTSGPTGLGQGAPHMVDCGLSSTLRLSQGWGLAGQASIGGAASPQARPLREHTDASPMPSAASSFTYPDAGSGTAGPVSGLRADIMAGLQDRIPAGVRDVIDRSLRQAGL